MLKKIVKYGNSNALVIDRAILELLGMSEGSIVKLHTDGKSLIITPTEPAKDTADANVSITSGLEMMAHARDLRVQQMEKTFNEATGVEKQQLEALMPGTEKSTKLGELYKNIMEKYKDDIVKLSSEAFIRDIDLLTEKYHGDKTAQGFTQEFFKLRLKYAPNLATMDKEMADAANLLLKS